ncbi:MAG: hypothetical protein R2747_22390 [Pyrinomonadaceae bacterium]
MTKIKRTREQLLKRQAEIEKQLNRVSVDERMELDNDLEDQAIQTEHQEVSTTMANNLLRELNEIEDELLDLDEED